MIVGDILFIRGNLLSPVDDAIKLGESIIDHTPFATNYTHVALYIGGNQIAEAQGNRVTGLNTLDAYAGNYDTGRVALTDEDRINLVAHADKSFGMRYDWGAILDLGYEALTGNEVPYHEMNRRICSTYVNELFLSIGIILVGKEVCTPEELALSPNVTITPSNG